MCLQLSPRPFAASPHHRQHHTINTTRLITNTTTIYLIYNSISPVINITIIIAITIFIIISSMSVFIDTYMGTRICIKERCRA